MLDLWGFGRIPWFDRQALIESLSGIRVLRIHNFLVQTTDRLRPDLSGDWHAVIASHLYPLRRGGKIQYSLNRDSIRCWHAWRSTGGPHRVAARCFTTPKSMSVLRLRSWASSKMMIEYWLSWSSSKHCRSSVPSAYHQPTECHLRQVNQTSIWHAEAP